MRFGIAALPVGKRRERLRDRFEHEVVGQFLGRILAFDEPATSAYVDLRARARAAGRGIGDFDALIAAIATACGHAVATRDTSPFEAAGLVVINPFESTGP
ncbi:putative VapC ribonuclease Y4jK (fragment) [metagenome]|uniref:Putative VapC ribonuclease Y4jK n=1 Tax=metagenome TaxID=256318 RepID=A0A2P2C786_9ZZZZ